MRDEHSLSIPCQNHWQGREGYTPKYIILHSTAGMSRAEDVAHYFQSTEGGNNPVSVNYIIGQDGEVVCCVDEDNAAYGNGAIEAGADSWWTSAINPNLISISIEHAKPDTTNMLPLTDAQQSASFDLIKRICTRWNIPQRLADASGGITGHFSISPASRAHCPGTYPWNELWAHLQQQETIVISLALPDVAKFFIQAPGGAWHCPKTNCTIGGGILNFYRLYANSALNGLTYLGLPMTNEIGLGGGTAMQRFERGVLVYDTNHRIDAPPGAGSVYLAHIYSGQGVDPRIAQLQSHLASAQSSTHASADAAKLAEIKKVLGV